MLSCMGTQTAFAEYSESKYKAKHDSQKFRTALHRLAGDDLFAFFGYLPVIKVIPDARPNAYALPPDTIMITEGLLGFIEHPDELAFVLAHELGHLTLHDDKAVSALHGHTLNRLYKQELEADAFAMDLLDDADIPARSGVQLLRRIHDFGSTRGTSYGTAYPSLTIRLRRLELCE